MTDAIDADPVYAEILFRIGDAAVHPEELPQEVPLPEDEAVRRIEELRADGLVQGQVNTDGHEVLTVGWDRLKERYVAWLDGIVDERIFFVEQIGREEFRTFYAPLLSYSQALRAQIVRSEHLTKVLRIGVANFGFLFREYRMENLPLRTFFNEFTIAFSNYEAFERIIGDDPVLRALSGICDRVLVNPFGYFAFHTEFFPTGTET